MLLIFGRVVATENDSPYGFQLFVLYQTTQDGRWEGRELADLDNFRTRSSYRHLLGICSLSTLNCNVYNTEVPQTDYK